MPTYPEKLMYLRYVFVLFSLVTTACVVGFAAKCESTRLCLTAGADRQPSRTSAMTASFW